MVTMGTMGNDLQPGCLADQLLTGLGQPQINPKAQKERKNVCVCYRGTIVGIRSFLEKGMADQE